MRAMAAYATRILAVFFLFFSQIGIGRARNLGIPLPTLAAQLLQRNGTEFDKRVDVRTEMSTCGYENGDPKKFRTANSGFDCRVDTMNGLWGFCPVTVIAATDCGLAGSCVDQGSCSSGCGKTANTKLTTFTCGPKQFCSTALLTFGVDQTYSYIGCGGSPRTDHYLVSPTTVSSSTSPTSETKSTDASSTNNSNVTANNTGAIIGGVIGGIALLCISGIVAILLLRRNQSHNHQTPTKRAQRDTHQSWYNPSPKTKRRFTGGWGPRELQGSQYERAPEHAIELPG